jgi:uncharacterized membrane protein
MEVCAMKVIGIPVSDQEHGEFVMGALRDAIERKQVTLEDMALVVKGDDGQVKIHQTKDITTGKGAFRGGLVGAVIGLAAPPLLGVTVLGAGAGALWGKLRDKGVDDNLMKNVAQPLENGQAVVFALGDDSSIDAIEARVKELTKGEMTTVTFDPDDESELRAMAQDIPMPEHIMVRAPIS